MKQKIQQYQETIKAIEQLVGGDWFTGLEIDLECNWAIEDGILQTWEGEDFDDRYEYILSSLGDKGKKFYMGEADGYWYIMAYDEDDGWSGAMVFVLDTNKQVK